MNQVTKLTNFIGGEFVEPSTKSWFEKLNPATGSNMAEVPDSDLLDVVRAIQAANKAWGTWQKSEVSQRVELLLAIAEALTSQAERLAGLQSLEEGSPYHDALKNSLPRASGIFRHHARLLETSLEKSLIGARETFSSHRLPYGVTAILTPWCDPFVNLASRAAASLAAGNVVIAKPSELAPQSAQAFAEVLHSAGLPSGVFNLVQGRGDKAGRALVGHPGLSLISFMGKTTTGRDVLAQSAEFLKRTHLALGARNPVLVFAGTDLKKSMPAIVAATMPFHGQTCLRGSRVFVQETIYDQFLESYQAEVAKLKTGDPMHEQTSLGPLVSPDLKARFEAAVSQSETEKGKLLFGGRGVPDGLEGAFKEGFFVRPTAVFDLTLCSTLQQEEVVGPLVTIASFKYQHDAIKQANNNPFGQAAYVFEPQAARAMRVAQKIEAGRVFINSSGPLGDVRMGFGGLKTSGLGREGGEELLNFFSKQTLISQSIGTEV
jgi:aminomuconate-semialdehyde/2-hydroxymuconate-6-semialdehyde dehydrogenase